MKKIYILFILILLIGIYGCKSENKSNDTDFYVKIIDCSDNLHNNIVLEENPLKNDSKKENKLKKSLKINSIFGQIDAKYNKSVKTNDQYFYCDVYMQTYPQAFIYLDPNGRIVKYQCLDNEELDDGEILSQEELTNKANDILSNYVDVSEYKVEFASCKELEDCFEISYTKYIDEIRTADYACITFNKYGQLISFNSSYLGMMDKSFKMNSNIDEIKIIIKEKIETILTDSYEKWDKIEFNDYDFTMVKLDDNDYALICNLGVSLVKHIDDNTDSVSGEMFKILINI